MDDDSSSYDLNLTASDSALIVHFSGRLTPEAGRHIREVVSAAERCGVPVEVVPRHVGLRISS